MKRIITAILIVAAFSSLSLAKYSGGTGEPNTPYQIANVADLMTLANDANDYNKCFIMTADLDLDPCLPGGQVFTTAVIARDTNNTNYGYNFEGNAFRGIFDGAGRRFSNLTIDTNGLKNEFLGLFGDVNGGEIKNLGLENVKIIGGNDSDCSGALAGRIKKGVISNCYSTGDINAGDQLQNIGGLVGSNGGSISNSFSISNVKGGNDYLSAIGGLAGGSGGTINNCFSKGTVTSGNFTCGTGGLVGGNSGTIMNSFSTSTTIGGNYSCEIGGLAGGGTGIVINCFSTGSVVGGTESYALGGLVGLVYGGSISNCYSTGAITGSSGAWDIGGLVGFVAEFGGDIMNCYSTGKVTGETSIGGLVGQTFSGTINGSYFLDIAGPANGYGLPLSDSQMKQPASFVYWDSEWEGFIPWNFWDIWHICENTNYPKLLWQIQAADLVCPDGVNFADYSFFAERWLNKNCATNNNCYGTDFDLSGTVDIDDLKVFTDYWLQGQ